LNRSLKYACFFLLGIFVVSLIAPLFLGGSSDTFHLSRSLEAPSLSHLMGFDEDGRDVFRLLVIGTQVSLGIGLATVLVTGFCGTIFGASAAYFGGRVDEFFVFVTDVLMAFPSILLVIALAAFQTEMSLLSLVLILCVVGWVSYARLVRGQVLALRKRDFILAEQVMGCGFWRLLFKHLLPNLAGPLLVQATFGIAGVIIAESTLSFLGLGVPPSIPSWGRLLDQGVQYLLVAPHLSIFPGLAIMITIIFLNRIGDGLRDRLDVRQ
jgi:peptide/nickel transport system permease protein